MFKRTPIITVVLLIFAMVLSLALLGGCQKAAQPPGNDDTPPEPTSKMGDIYFSGATMGGGGNWDMIGTGLGKIIKEEIPESRITFVPAEGVANVITLSKGEADIGFTSSVMAFLGFHGSEPYKEKLDGIRGLASLYDAPIQFVVLESVPIDSLDELASKKPKIRIAVGDPGSTNELETRLLLESVGVTFADIESWGGTVVHKGFGEAGAMMSDGLIDAICSSGRTMSFIQEVSLKTKLKMVSMSEATVQYMVDNLGLDTATIEKGTYNFVTEDMISCGHTTIIACSKDMPEEDIYKLTKALVENVDQIAKIHSNCQYLTAEAMAKGLGAPLHPGAEKYYKEANLIK